MATDAEYGSIQREIHIDAAPEVVFDVVSNPAHVMEWWADEADFAPVPGAVGELVWRDKATAHPHVASITVVDAVPPRLFSFRWVYPDGEAATDANSLLVTFELVPDGAGTVLHLTESGFREMGWEAAVLEDYYNDHVSGWEFHIARLEKYCAQVGAPR
jgi:uncharacterized protein YndB with AHSA1/START domain